MISKEIVIKNQILVLSDSGVKFNQEKLRSSKNIWWNMKSIQIKARGFTFDAWSDSIFHFFFYK